MKLKNKLFTGLICLSTIAITACGGKDDDGPSTPENKGTFTGKYTTAAGEVSQWAATSATAVLDTSIYGDLTITATNASGDVITIVLTDANETAHLMKASTANYSTYSTASLTAPATTETDDGSNATLGNISISDNGDSDNLLKGNSIDNFVKWLIVDPDDDDVTFAVMENISFSAPLTRIGFDGSGGGGSGESSLSLDINGNPFNSTFCYATGTQGMFLILASNGTASVTVKIPSGATTGNHDLSQMQGYSVSYLLDGSTSIFTSSSGTMNISAINGSAGTITGTFSCTATDAASGDDLSMTNGSFNVD